MAKRDEEGGLLRAHDTGELSDRENVALLCRHSGRCFRGGGGDDEVVGDRSEEDGPDCGGGT